MGLVEMQELVHKIVQDDKFQRIIKSDRWKKRRGLFDASSWRTGLSFVPRPWTHGIKLFFHSLL